ncbi:MAG: hypothetical protein JXB50_05380 [Spirochaetes bacterium]|nr:hypothetical protein [Spirochaetota bacterium]
MNEFDFKNWYIILAIFVAHIYRHYSLLDKIPEEKEKLKNAIKDYKSGQANPDGINSRCKKLKKTIFNVDTIILHLLAFIILIAFIIIILDIPKKLLDAANFGPLAEPILLGEKVIYLLISLLFFLSYIIKAVVPSVIGFYYLGKVKEVIKFK